MVTSSPTLGSSYSKSILPPVTPSASTPFGTWKSAEKTTLRATFVVDVDG